MNTIVKKGHCRTCLHPYNAHTSLKGNVRPKEDDVTVCAYCGRLSKFDKHLNLIELTEEEIILLKYEHPDTYRILRKAQSLIQEKANEN